MDITKYFKRRAIVKEGESEVGGEGEYGKKPRTEKEAEITESAQEPCDVPKIPAATRTSSTLLTASSENDIGNYVTSYLHVTEDKKYELIKCSWTPSRDYNFQSDIVLGSRPFKVEWLQTYPWLVYSKTLKGALCRHCVFFRPVTTHGSSLGRFIVKPFQHYKDFHKAARLHLNSKWHIDATMHSTNFISVKENRTVSVEQQLNTSYKNKISENREKLKPILSTLLFCALHDLPFRGQDDRSAVFNDLLQFRIESGDENLREHLETSAKNATYISHRTQNELLECCSVTLREELVSGIKKSPCFSVIADETADIRGVEHLSVCVRYVNNDIICEDFLGFFSLEQFDAAYIADTILHSCNEIGLDMNKCVGQGYDGCSTMAGYISGVQSRIRNVFPMAGFFHCSNHRLNLVINDLNNLPDVRNTVSTIKETIRFIRDSAIRLKAVGSKNVKRLCETRWTEKHKSIRHFNDNFAAIVEGLEHISTTMTFNSKVRQRAHELLCALSTPTTIVILKTMAKYSAKFEPITVILQGVSVDLLEATKHLRELLIMLQSDRQNADEVFELIFEDSRKTADNINLELKAPRRTVRQTNRANHPTENVRDYFKQSLYIPYMDSIIMSINDRFSDEKSKSFSLFHLHPEKIKNMDCAQYEKVIENVIGVYGNILDNFKEEAFSWYQMWKNRALTEADTNMELIDLLRHSSTYFPSVTTAIKIALTLPATTCSAERSFR